MTSLPLTCLLLGSSGFIGHQVCLRLAATHHQLRTPSRDEVNFTNPNWDDITQLLQGVDVVINMVGIMSQDAALLEHVHHHFPKQLANVAKRTGVKRWINLSALGADAHHKVAFVSSKGRGDAALLQLADDTFQVIIGRPSLVFGRGGASCELFIKLAQLPVLLMPAAGNYQIQPVHVNDVAQGIVNLISAPISSPTIINFTGGSVCSVADYLTMLREDIHSRDRLTIISIPTYLAKIAILVARPFSGGMISVDSLTLLEEGATADNSDFTQLLAYAPLGYRAFITHIS